MRNKKSLILYCFGIVLLIGICTIVGRITAKSYIDNSDELEGIWVYDDEFVKGVIHHDGKQIVELYVDSFFENQGIGSKLIKYAIEQLDCDFLWVLEKNINAIRFYQRHGFMITEEKQYEEGTTEHIVKMKR